MSPRVKSWGAGIFVVVVVASWVAALTYRTISSGHSKPQNPECVETQLVGTVEYCVHWVSHGTSGTTTTTGAAVKRCRDSGTLDSAACRGMIAVPKGDVEHAEAHCDSVWVEDSGDVYPVKGIPHARKPPSQSTQLGVAGCDVADPFAR